MKANFLFFLLSIAIITKGQQKKVILDSVISDSVSVKWGGKLSSYKDYQNCVFTKSVKFDHTIFPVQGPLIFRGTIFSSYANFSSTQFIYCAGFSGAKFYGNVSFDNVKVYSGMDFILAEFKHPASFVGGNYYGGVFFASANFYHDVSFSGTIFNTYVDFEATKFSKNSSFNGCTFEDNVTFWGTTFHHQVDFSFATFSKSLTLRQLDLHDSATFLFYSARLPRLIDLSVNSYIPHEIDLLTANLNPLNGMPDVIHNIYLYKSDISKIHFDYIHFKLLFTNPISHHKLTPDATKSIYEQVLKNFKDRGQEISYENLDIEYQDYKWGDENIWWKKQFGKLIKWWWNYGYSKENVFFHSAYFVFLFTLLNFFILNLLQDVYNVSKIPKTRKLRFKNYRVAQLLLRLWYSFAYTSTIFFKLSIKTEEIDFKHAVRSLYILFIYTLGLICLAYMANFVLQK
jgi:hypothetical protein